MIIIIEGTDGAGKTSIGKKLAKELGAGGSIWTHHKPLNEYASRFADFRRRGVLPSGFNDAAEDVAATELALKAGINVVFDRSVMSADIYRQVHGRTALSRDFKHWYWNEMLRPFWDNGEVAFIEIVSDIDTMWGRRSDRFTRDQIRYIMGLFEVSRKDLPKGLPQLVLYNTQNDVPATGVQEAVAEIMAWIELKRFSY